jgi:hypothetical protein
MTHAIVMVRAAEHLSAVSKGLDPGARESVQREFGVVRFRSPRAARRYRSCLRRACVRWVGGGLPHGAKCVRRVTRVCLLPHAVRTGSRRLERHTPGAWSRQHVGHFPGSRSTLGAPAARTSPVRCGTPAGRPGAAACSGGPSPATPYSGGPPPAPAIANAISRAHRRQRACCNAQSSVGCYIDSGLGAARFAAG